MALSALISTSVVAAPAASTTNNATPTANQSTFKIGIIDIGTIVSKSPEAQAIGEALRKEFQAREASIANAEKALREKEGKIERNGSVMGEAERSKLEKEIHTAKRDLHRMQVEFREDTTLRQREEMEKFLNKIRGVVKDIAKAENYNLILHSEAVPYSDDKTNITDKVMKKLSQKN